MKIPKKLKIGGHEVSVVFHQIKDENGSFEPRTNTITIDPTLAKSQQEATFIHEVLHAINTSIDEIPLGHAFMDGLAEQLYQVLSENKLLK